MAITVIILCIVGGYLWGSVSLARIITKIIAPGKNLEEVELPDRNTGGTFQLKTVGATTASMILGPKIGGLIGILDILKGFLPTLLVRLLIPEYPYYLIIGLAILVGHILPLYFDFKGGGGLSPALGTLLVVDPLGLLISILAGMVIGVFILKNIAFIVMGGPFLFMIWIALRTRDWILFTYTLILNLLLIIAVIPDVRHNIQAQRSGKSNLSTSMDSIPMGQMMKKMLNRMGLMRDKK
jgi:glycerol-3-phosphate acyltransferase PlsY